MNKWKAGGLGRGGRLAALTCTAMHNCVFIQSKGTVLPKYLYSKEMMTPLTVKICMVVIGCYIKILLVKRLVGKMNLPKMFAIHLFHLKLF